MSWKHLKKTLVYDHQLLTVWQYYISKEVKEFINLFHYNINIACKHSNGLIQAEWHVLMRNKGLKIELRLTDNRLFF